jgi:hypothetical protein
MSIQNAKNKRLKLTVFDRMVQFARIDVDLMKWFCYTELQERKFVGLALSGKDCQDEKNHGNFRKQSDYCRG